ncbi:uncharacterized protein LOC128223133 isoform X2 [Mya arenaria]|uniref:uncharacterized protein LOC128223133 isoform X2 n=1 Tax=Mya arenaria TaxID=6604 RepID=UPI0022E2D421|nr:uncharacterized protein LOC128223133 isoform X2 [Mya arenaria]
MGCSSSTQADLHPSIYNETILKPKLANGEAAPRPEKRVLPASHLQGDYSQFLVAKHAREKQLKDRQIKLFMAADAMSGRMLEEREMFSLGTRSRATSRDTSRATSPTPTNRRSVQFKDEIHAPPMTPVAEVKSQGSFRRDDSSERLEPREPSKRKHKSKKSNTKKHRKGKKSKKSKHTKSEKDAIESDSEDDNGDSGLENDEAETAETNHVDANENEVIDTVVGVNSGLEETEEVEQVTSKRSSRGKGAAHKHKPTKKGKGSSKHNTHHKDLKPKGVDNSIHSSSKDSGIHVVDGASGLPNAEEVKTTEDIGQEERSDSRI